MNNTPQKQNIHRNLVFPIIGILVVIVSMIFVLNRTAIRDTLRAYSFEKTPAIINLENKLNITESARRTFEASFPSLDAGNIFNEHCDSHDINSAVLGCFAEEQIYIYDIQSTDLNGIVESTAAHELLHAAWSRLSGYEKDQLATTLEQAYQDNCATLCDTLSVYDSKDQLDEIHSRLGTQIANLPEELERYYAKYFNDRKSIVAFYEQYSSVFENIKNKIDTLSTELTNLKSEIDTLTATYTSGVDSYASKVKDFNSCAATAGCFSSSAFNTEHKKLVTEYNNLNVMFSELDIKILEYNNKVSEYNNTLIYGQKIENLINSNSAPAEI